MQSSFVAQFVEGSGPPPQQELERIVAQTEPNDANEGDLCAWFPTRKGLGGWKGGEGPAKCILFCRVAGDSDCIVSVSARILNCQGEMPDVPAVQDYYQDHDFSSWWQVTDVELRRDINSLTDIPGTSANGGRAACDSFAGMSTFAFWNFGGGLPNVVQAIEEPVPPAPLITRFNPQRVVTGEWPDIALHGVDFSGGAEAGDGNRKIWIASLQSGHLTLRNGQAHRFRRAHLANLIRNEGGWWTLDFPFGIARETAAAIGVRTWAEWLAWTRVDGVEGTFATSRRDAARIACESANCRWGIRRAADEEHRTTWFPLFEQLYRQTICGAAEVLYPLSLHEDVSVLPWTGIRPGSSAVVAEGFPGITIRAALGMRATGYKGPAPDRHEARVAIVDALATYGLPLTPEIAALAIADAEGDAIDALVLLIASKTSYDLGPERWEEQRRAMEDNPEGWFPA